MTIVSELHSQSTDVVWIPRKDALAKLEQIERLKADSVELYQRRLEVVDQRNIINSLRSSLENSVSLTRTLEMRIDNYISQVSNLERALRKQKRKTTLVTFGGIALSASLLFFMIK